MFIKALKRNISAQYVVIVITCVDLFLTSEVF